MSNKDKQVFWIGSAYKDWLNLPEDVQDVMGYSLHLAQCGEKADNVKPLRGFKGASVLEIVDDYNTDTYRAIYTVQFEGSIYVLHTFQKKSKKGISTPESDIKLIEKRLINAKEHHEQQRRKH